MPYSRMEGSQTKTDVQDRRLSLIDVSSADDSLIHPISGNPFDHQDAENQADAELLDTPNSKKFEDASQKLEEWEQAPQPTETFELEKARKTSKCNLRKSLAWDSAFFTSAGVLDPEELSSIIEGTEKDEKYALPMIQEELSQSCESISTLESDSLTLESFDADLFEDIRASIQKSSKMSTAANANSRVLSGVARFQAGDSANKVGMASWNKMKASPASKNPSASMQGSGKMIKKNPVYPQASQKLVASRRESSISKQLMVLGKSSPSPSPTMLTKRASPGDVPVKSEKDKANGVTSGRVSSASKAPVIGSSRGSVPKPTLPSNSSLGLSFTTKTKATMSKSYGSNSSDKIGKSPFNFPKGKVVGGTIKPPSSGSAVRTASRITLKSKTESRNSSLAGLKSVTKLSSSISPASSISDWSSESSSSTSMAKHRSNSSRTSLDSTSSRKVVSGTDTTQTSNSQYPLSDSNLEGHETQLTGFVSQCPGTTSAGTILAPASMKPSGLRLPSPKIGFFDGVKSLVHTPRGGTKSQSVVPGGLPKNGAGSVIPSERQNKAKNKKRSSEIAIDVQNNVLLKSNAGDLKANNSTSDGHFIGIRDFNLCSTRTD